MILPKITTLGKRSHTTNRMSFQTIYRERKKCKYFVGLYPEQCDASFEFFGPAKENLTYWNSKPTTGVRSRFPIQKFILEEQLFITLLRLRHGFQLETLAHCYGVSEFTIRHIFTTWIMFLFHHFKDHNLLMFPESNEF